MDGGRERRRKGHGGRVGGGSSSMKCRRTTEIGLHKQVVPEDEWCVCVLALEMLRVACGSEMVVSGWPTARVVQFLT